MLWLILFAIMSIVGFVGLLRHYSEKETMKRGRAEQRLFKNYDVGLVEIWSLFLIGLSGLLYLVVKSYLSL